MPAPAPWPTNFWLCELTCDCELPFSVQAEAGDAERYDRIGKHALHVRARETYSHSLAHGRSSQTTTLHTKDTRGISSRQYMAPISSPQQSTSSLGAVCRALGALVVRRRQNSDAKA